VEWLKVKALSSAAVSQKTKNEKKKRRENIPWSRIGRFNILVSL
jgi:hypothetical protein